MNAQPLLARTAHTAIGALTLAALPALALDVDLSTYTLSARYALPEPTLTAAPAGNLLAQEASAVTWNRDTNTLFIVGDGSTAIVQVSLTGALINSMTLAQDPTKPQGTAYYDTEGLTYVGGGQFILVEERLRVVSRFTYTAGTTLAYADAQHIKLGTTVGNIGIEGIAYDPLTGGIVAAKEISPSGIFSTTMNFAAGTASNGSASTVNSTNLFDPALAGVLDFADLYALSALNGISAADQGHLLLLSQESGKIVEVDRLGNIYSTLNIPLLPGVAGNLNLADQQHEGITMDDAGNLYTVAENGGGDINHPELWVYTPTAAVPEAQTSALLLAGLGLLALGARRRRAVATLGLAALAGAAHADIRITEVAPYGSGQTASYAADWFELTNTGSTAVDISGWKVDDNSNSAASAVALRGVSSIAAGQSVIFLEGLATGSTDATLNANFITAWFGGSAPADFVVGNYGGSGVGLSTTADAVNIYTASGTLVTRVDFGASTTGRSFDNSAALDNATLTQLSTLGVNGAFTSSNAVEIGTPGTVVAAPVPEPGSWALMLFGMGGLVGLMGLRRR